MPRYFLGAAQKLNAAGSAHHCCRYAGGIVQPTGRCCSRCFSNERNQCRASGKQRSSDVCLPTPRKEPPTDDQANVFNYRWARRFYVLHLRPRRISSQACAGTMTSKKKVAVHYFFSCTAKTSRKKLNSDEIKELAVASSPSRYLGICLMIITKIKTITPWLGYQGKSTSFSVDATMPCP